MSRRDLLRSSALPAAALATRTRAQTTTQAATQTTPDPAIKRVLLVTKCHLDVGFTNTQHNVVQKYYNVYYPAAIALATQLRTTPDGPRYTWTTGSWLLYTYLEQATPDQRRTMEQAIQNGDIAWHALPFSWQTELLPRSMIEGGLSFSQALDRRFGTHTTGAKMTDVPGHTRGLIAPLAAAGVILLDIGINAASTPPVVPDLFRWQNHTGQEIIVLYHRHDYGSTLPIPGSDLAVSVVVKNDNLGPHTLAELLAIHARLHQQFPNATVQAASLTQVANAVAPYRNHLPIVTGEIGDTWIYGIPSDPPKVARSASSPASAKSGSPKANSTPATPPIAPSSSTSSSRPSTPGALTPSPTSTTSTTAPPTSPRPKPPTSRATPPWRPPGRKNATTSPPPSPPSPPHSRPKPIPASPPHPEDHLALRPLLTYCHPNPRRPAPQPRSRPKHRRHYLTPAQSLRSQLGLSRAPPRPPHLPDPVCSGL